MNKIVLASGSPRRKEILNKYNINPIIHSADMEEKQHQDEIPVQVAMGLALEKAIWVNEKLSNGEIIIAADTIVVVEDKILGKPKDEEDAFNMLSLLSGREHYVITAIAIIKNSSNIKVVDYETTTVRFRHLTKSQILRYIETKEPLDKAGAYGIQGYGELLVEGITGCYSNVVGLPIGKLDHLLSRYFDIQIL